MTLIDAVLPQVSWEFGQSDVFPPGGGRLGERPFTPGPMESDERLEVLLSSLTGRQRERLFTLCRMNPERRFEFLRPTDGDFSLLNECLTFNPERLHTILGMTSK